MPRPHKGFFSTLHHPFGTGPDREKQSALIRFPAPVASGRRARSPVRARPTRSRERQLGSQRRSPCAASPSSLQDHDGDPPRGLPLVIQEPRGDGDAVGPDPLTLLPLRLMSRDLEGLGARLRPDLDPRPRMCVEVVVPPGLSGAPALDATTTYRSASRWYITGVVRSSPLRAPVVVSSSNWSPKSPTPLPALAWNSWIIASFQLSIATPFPLTLSESSCIPKVVKPPRRDLLSHTGQFKTPPQSVPRYLEGRRT
jgi:hypothetical protein